MQNIKQNSLEVIDNKQVIRIHPPKKITKVKDARRLLANLIYVFQKGEITSDYLKTICYALIKYSELFKVESLESIEEKVLKIEEKLNELKKV